MGPVRSAITRFKAAMTTAACGARCLPPLIGGIAGVVLVASGVAAVAAWMPSSTDVAAVAFVFDKVRLPAAGAEDAQAQAAHGPAGDSARASVRCTECGIVRSTREIGQLGGGIEPASAGGGTRSGPNEMRRQSAAGYEVTVGMIDGSTHVFTDASAANWRPGERVIIIRGASRPGN